MQMFSYSQQAVPIIGAFWGHGSDQTLTRAFFLLLYQEDLFSKCKPYPVALGLVPNAEKNFQGSEHKPRLTLHLLAPLWVLCHFIPTAARMLVCNLVAVTLCGQNLMSSPIPGRCWLNP